MPWRDAMRFYTGIFIVSFSIALAFAAKGVWMILPFAGLEMLVLWIALYMVARRGTCWQTISIGQDVVDVEDRGIKARSFERFQRAWVRVELEKPRINGHPSRLVLRSHGRCVEVGGYLTESEKQRLASDLHKALGNQTNPAVGLDG